MVWEGRGHPARYRQGGRPLDETQTHQRRRRGAQAMIAPVEKQSNRLPVLAASIRDHLAAAESATVRGLEHAVAAGLLLIEAKELVREVLGPGKWIEWLEEEANCH